MWLIFIGFGLLHETTYVKVKSIKSIKINMSGNVEGEAELSKKYYGYAGNGHIGSVIAMFCCIKLKLPGLVERYI